MYVSCLIEKNKFNKTALAYISAKQLGTSAQYSAYIKTSSLKNTLFSNEKIYMYSSNAIVESRSHKKPVNRYYTHYKKNVCRDIIYKQNIRNSFTIPKVNKITLNITHKNIVNDKKNILAALASLELVVGQKIKWTSAKDSISMFKIRKNQIIGCKVDLRKNNMFCFLEKLITIILPCVRDFKPVSMKNLNTYGYLTIGLSDILMFPELENYFEFFTTLKGVDVCLVTKNKKKLETLNLISAFQMPSK